MAKASVISFLLCIAVSYGGSFHIRDSNGSVAIRPLTFSAGSTVILDCSFNVTSENSTAFLESLLWTRNGTEVSESGSTSVPVRQFTVNGTQRLVIAVLTAENQGVYTCVRNASNVTLPFTSVDVIVLLDTDGQFGELIAAARVVDAYVSCLLLVCSQCHPNATCEMGPLGVPRCRCNRLFSGNGTYCGKYYVIGWPCPRLLMWKSICATMKTLTSVCPVKATVMHTRLASTSSPDSIACVKHPTWEMAPSVQEVRMGVRHSGCFYGNDVYETWTIGML